METVVQNIANRKH